jgi:uncharacterized protein YegP (UPF0339 family)
MYFWIKKSSNGQFYFTVEAANRKVLATSETYWNKGDCRHAAELIKSNAGGASILDAS